MRNQEYLVNLAISAFLLLQSTNLVAETSADTEKCYGVVKAGMNDCATATASCASSSTKDNQADAFIFVPKGLCEKLTNGHLTATKESS